MPTTGSQKLEMPTTMAGTAEATSGDAYPLGATLQTAGANFSVFASNATGVQIVLFDHTDDQSGSRVVTLDPSRNRTADYWHVFLPGIEAGQL